MINSMRPVALASLLAYGEVQNGNRPGKGPEGKSWSFRLREIPMKRFFGLLIILFLGGFTSTLGESGTQAGGKGPVKVAVPEQWRTSPFDRERILTVPVGATISVLARVRGARFLAVSPNGDILVSQPSMGKILLIRQSRPSEVYELISGLRLPHGMVFHRIGDALYLY